MDWEAALAFAIGLVAGVTCGLGVLLAALLYGSQPVARVLMAVSLALTAGLLIYMIVTEVRMKAPDHDRG